MNNLIKSKLELLPTSPGCYIHKDKNGTIIYVGKAKNLRNRVRSYFRGSHDTKTERWYLRLWILSLSSPSPILRPCFSRSTSSRRTNPSTISCSRTTSPIPSSRLPMSATRVSSSRDRSKRMAVSISVPIRMWGRPMRSSDS